MATPKKKPAMKATIKEEMRGRPTKYRPEFCKIAIELGRLGKSKAQIAAHPEIDVSRVTLDAWADEHPEFLYALTRAKDLALAAWEDRADTGIASIGFNSGLWSRVMSARFPADYREVRVNQMTGADGGAVKTEEVGAGFAGLHALMAAGLAQADKDRGKSS